MRVRYQTARCRNGMRVALAHLPESECVAYSLHLPVGGRHDPAGRAGLAHFLEHLSFKGTATRDARDLSFEIENAGAGIDAFTCEDETAYEARGDAETLPKLVEILADMLWHSTYPPGEIELEGEVIAEEILMYRENPSDHIGDLLSAATWAPHPLGEPITGTEDTLARIDRPAILDFAATHHRRRDLVIAVAGPYDMAEVLELVDAVVPEATNPPPPPVPAPPPDGPRERSEIRDTHQLQFALAHRGFGRRDPRRHALMLLSMILGEGSSSRLFQSLREERGLCYQVDCQTNLFEEAGTLEIHAGLDPEAAEEAREVIDAECRDLVANGPRADELARAKRLATSSNRAAMESTASHASWVARALLDHGRVVTPAEALAELDAVTPDQVRAVARQIFQPLNRATAEIRGPETG